MQLQKVAKERCEAVRDGVLEVEERANLLVIGRHVPQDEADTHHNVLEKKKKKKKERMNKRKQAN